MAANVETARIAAEAAGIFIGPCDAATNLVRHNAEIPTSFFNGYEVKSDEMSTRVDEQLSRISVVFRLPTKPRAAMDENEDWRVGSLGTVNIELFYLRWTIGFTSRRTKACTRKLTVTGEAL